MAQNVKTQSISSVCEDLDQMKMENGAEALENSVVVANKAEYMHTRQFQF